VNCNKYNLYADEQYFPQLENMLMNSDSIVTRILLKYDMKFFYVKLSAIIITYQWCFGSFIPLPFTLKLNASKNEPGSGDFKVSDFESPDLNPHMIDIYSSLFNIFLILLPRNLGILLKPS
jgi:hypothetical protein